MERLEGLSNIKMNEDMNLYPSREVLEKQSRSGRKHVILEGDWNGRHFAIIRHSCGFPDAYVEVKKTDWIYRTELDSGDNRYEYFDGWVHGDATYYGECYWNKEDDRPYLGWDYGHYNDFESLTMDCLADTGNNDRGQKWTLSEILMDIAGVCHDLDWMNRTRKDDE